MDLKYADSLLLKGPCILEGNELSALLLLNIDEIKEPVDLDKELDDINYRMPRSRILVKKNIGRIARRLPNLTLRNEPPSKKELNYIISKKFSLANSLLMKQSEISHQLMNVDPDETAILIIVDGLSFHDVKDLVDCQPIIVDGPTLTEFGVLNIVGNPTIANLMFNKGKKKIFGYSYWTRDDEEKITRKAFEPIPKEDFYEYRNFKEVLNDLESKDISRSYIQIITAGLDNLCHKYRDEPPISNTISSILDKLDSVERVCKDNEIRSTIFLTSDHGILWRDDNDFIVKSEDKFQEGGHRWTKGKNIGDDNFSFLIRNRNITSFAYPYISGTIAKNEWGLHGGVSYEESIIPLIKRTVF